MANLGTLHRFRIGLSDIERGIYADLDFRLQRHASESPGYLLTRVLAYALNYEDALKFSSGGLSDPEAPALQVLRSDGSLDIWIEIGQPSPRRLHRASKAARTVRVYCYRDPSVSLREWERERIHHSEKIEIYSWDGPWLEELAATLLKDNHWTILYSDGSLVITVGKDLVFQGDLQRWSLKTSSR